MTSTPPGWYDDGHGARRWWDGIRWTEHVQSEAPAPIGGTQAESHAAEAPPADAAVTPPTYPAVTPPTYPAVPPPTYPAVPPTQQKSKLWILWVVIGVVVLGLVITAIVVIPMTLASLGGGGEPSDADEQAAVAAVALWDDAWNDVDCDKFIAATTESLRAAYEASDCAAFEERAQLFADTTDDYEVEITSVQRDGDSIVVTTTETYVSSVDESGETLDTPATVVEEWEYDVVPVDGGWAIDDTVSRPPQ